MHLNILNHFFFFYVPCAVTNSTKKEPEKINIFTDDCSAESIKYKAENNFSENLLRGLEI